MTATAFWHLAWKEYRVNRAYWLSLVILVMIADVSTAMMSPRSPTALNTMILGLSLAMPALFAVGSAGMAFAIEREEGTLEFLRGVAASPKQLLASKLFVTFVGTVALYALLLPIALYFSAGQIPMSETLGQMLDLWIVAALEAIAWGTFFSLLGSRPLLAICEAIFVTALFALLAIVESEYSPPGHYTASAPWRILIALTVLAIDVYLADFWPDRQSGESWLRTIRRQNKHLIDVDAPTISVPDFVRTFAGQKIVSPTARLSQRFLGRECSTSLGRLLWQQWRQSARTMALLATMYVAVIAADRFLLFRFSVDWAIFLSFLHPLVAALVGCFVFRADQPRHGYRFFAEQNVRPTYVWISRIVPWLALFLILEIGRCFVFDRNGRTPWAMLFDIPWMLLLPLAAFSIGQWTSMFVRSAVVAIALAAAGSIILCFWFDLFGPIWVLFPWTAAMLFGPISLVLLAATWLRSRDWIFENRAWRARIRAALILLIPGIAICVGDVLYRAYQIPSVSPGFDIATIDRPISAESAEMARLYVQASLHFVPRVNPPRTLPTAQAGVHAIETDIHIDDAWLAANAESLKLVLQASGRPSDNLYDPRTAVSPQPLNISGLAELVYASGNQLLNHGELDAALERYFAGLRIACRFDVTRDPNPPDTQDSVALTKPWQFPGEPPYPNAVPIASYFSAFPSWAAEKGQTPERIDAAIDRLRQLDAGILLLRQKIQWHYEFARYRLLSGERPIYPISDFENRAPTNSAFDWLPLFPWDRVRASRMLNLLTANSLERLQAIDDVFARGSDIANSLPSDLGLGGFFWINSPARGAQLDPKTLDEILWLEATRPFELVQIADYGLSKAIELADFETARRGTMLQLAIQSYRLKHASLPKSLSELVGPNLRVLPTDPYTGGEFKYFPGGILEQMQDEFTRQERDLSQANVGAPGVWCEGADQYSNGGFLSGNRFWYAREQPELATTWYRGVWFPIPKQKH